MPIPYKIKKIYPEKVVIFSYFFLHPHLQKETIEEYFLKFNGVKKARCTKNKGILTLEFDSSNFDLIELINFFEKSSYEIILSEISKTKTSEPNGKRNNWFLWTSLGFLPYLMRSSLPYPLLSGITFLLSTPVFKKALKSLSHKKLDVHSLDSLAIFASLLSKNPLSSHLMIFLLSLGDYLADKIEQKAYTDVKKLFGVNKDYAWLMLSEGESKKVRADELKPGDMIAVYAGEKITADGKVIEGEAW